MRSVRPSRVAVTAVACLTLGPFVAGCGGDEPATGVSADDRSSTAVGSEQSDSPSASSPSASSSSDSASASPSKAALSDYEDEPSVEGARAWAKAMAQDVNNTDTSYSLARPLSTARAQTKFSVYEGDDLTAGRRMPGPLPFTPVNVRGSASEATIDICYWVKGWARDPQTGQPAETKSIIGAGFDMIKSKSGVWQVNALYANDSVNCGDVIVKGVRS